MTNEYVSISNEMNVITVSLSTLNNTIRVQAAAVFTSFLKTLFNDVYTRSPVDSQEYKDSWDVREVSGADSINIRLSNSAKYASIMETGSEEGSIPWPSVGPRTAEVGGRIWSSQMPEPVLGGALEKADWDVLSEQLTEIVKGNL